MEWKLVQDLLRAGRDLHARNMLAGNDGNLSYRIDDRRILITPSQRPKIFLRQSEIAWLALDGTSLKGRVSSEHKVHLEIYRAVRDARCVIHAHPPCAVAWTLAHPEASELPAEYLAEVIVACGRIPIIPYATPGSDDLAANVRALLPEHRVMLLARHGAVSWGETIEEAYCGIERIEHVAQILRDAFALGRPEPLPATEIDKLRALRSKLGPRTL